jgi:hypothetical protein
MRTELRMSRMPRAVPQNSPSYPEFPDNCIRLKFNFFEYIPDVLVDRPHVLLEQLTEFGSSAGCA